MNDRTRKALERVQEIRRNQIHRHGGGQLQLKNAFFNLLQAWRLEAKSLAKTKFELEEIREAYREAARNVVDQPRTMNAREAVKTIISECYRPQDAIEAMEKIKRGSDDYMKQALADIGVAELQKKPYEFLPAIRVAAKFTSEHESPVSNDSFLRDADQQLAKNVCELKDMLQSVTNAFQHTEYAPMTYAFREALDEYFSFQQLPEGTKVTYMKKPEGLDVQEEQRQIDRKAELLVKVEEITENYERGKKLEGMPRVNTKWEAIRDYEQVREELAGMDVHIPALE